MPALSLYNPGRYPDLERVMAFSCVVVTPEQQLLDESLTQAIIPASDGLLGILTNRAPVLAKLGKGPLRLDLASGQRRLFRVEGGIAQMKDNKLTILTHGVTEQTR
jgi:F-type H+-transporting ATPase subunit epsilon